MTTLEVNLFKNERKYWPLDVFSYATLDRELRFSGIELLKCPSELSLFSCFSVSCYFNTSVNCLFLLGEAERSY